MTIRGMNKPLVLAFLVILGISFFIGNSVTAQTVTNDKLTKSGNYYLFPETANLKPVLDRMSNNIAAAEAILVNYTGANPKFANYANHEYVIGQTSTSNGTNFSHFITLYLRSGTGDQSIYTPIDCDGSLLGGVYRIPIPTQATVTFSDILNNCDATLPDDLEFGDSMTHKIMETYLNPGTTMVNESITLGNYTTDSDTITSAKTPVVQQTSSLLQGDYTQCTPGTNPTIIQLQAGNKYNILSTNLPNNQGMGASFSPNSNYPINIIFTAGGVQRYLLQVFSYGTTGDKATIRTNLCFNEGGAFKNYWTNVNYISYSDEKFTKKDQTVVSNITAATLTVKESLSNPEIQARFLKDYRNEISAYFYIVESKGIMEVQGIAFDASRDVDNTTLRAKLTDSSIEALRAKVPAFKDLTPNDIQKRVQVTLQGKQNTTGKIGDLIFQDVAEGQIATPNSYNEKYYKSNNPLSAGPYIAKITIDPVAAGTATTTEWEIIEKDIVLSPADFSPADSKIINYNHVYRIAFDVTDIIKDICSKCDDLVSCLACVDNRITTSYER